MDILEYLYTCPNCHCEQRLNADDARIMGINVRKVIIPCDVCDHETLTYKGEVYGHTKTTEPKLWQEFEQVTQGLKLIPETEENETVHMEAVLALLRIYEALNPEAKA